MGDKRKPKQRKTNQDKQKYYKREVKDIQQKLDKVKEGIRKLKSAK